VSPVLEVSRIIFPLKFRIVQDGLKRMLKAKRTGVSPVLSAMLMVLIVMSLASIVLLWSMGAINESRDVYEVVFKQKVEKVKERILIENVKFKLDTPQEIRIYVRNIGKISATIDHVYIDNQLIALNTPLKLEMGKGNYIVINEEKLPFTLEEGETYLITIATPRGKAFSSYWSS